MAFCAFNHFIIIGNLQQSWRRAIPDRDRESTWRTVYPGG